MVLEHLLHGDSLFLRQLNCNDASESYLSWLLDSEITRNLELRFNPPQTIKELENFIDSCADSKDTLLLGIFLSKNSKHIGNIKLGPINFNHSSSEIGLLIGDRGEWGKGHGTVAIQLLTEYAFNRLDLSKLTAGCYSENFGSLKAFLKAGFSQEGCKLSQYKVGDQRQDGILLGKINPRIVNQKRMDNL